MSKIFELFGHPVGSETAEAADCIKRAWCPFMNAECDGGGNRQQSALQVNDDSHALAQHIERRGLIQAGVCALLVKGKPWIVCPRRLLSLREEQVSTQAAIRQKIKKFSSLQEGEQYRTWSEVKFKSTIEDDDPDIEDKTFDYTFDYVVAGKRRVPIEEVARMVGLSAAKCRKTALENNFTLVRSGGVDCVDDFPSLPFLIIEVMTSSTSGGNKKKRTQIAMAFEDALLNGDAHEGPGINYRQVWARMVSQLLVKSEVASKWGGETLWVLQDVLADYISNTTALDLSRFLASRPDEVNILALGYGDTFEEDNESMTMKLNDAKFYAGPITGEGSDKSGGGFVEIIKLGAAPPVDKLWRALFLKKPSGRI